MPQLFKTKLNFVLYIGSFPSQVGKFLSPDGSFSLSFPRPFFYGNFSLSFPSLDKNVTLSFSSLMGVLYLFPLP